MSVALAPSSTLITLPQAREQSLVTIHQGFQESLEVIAASAKADPLAKVINRNKGLGIKYGFERFFKMKMARFLLK